MTILSVLHRVFADKACFLCGEESDYPVCPGCASSFRTCDPGWSDRRLTAGPASGFSAYWYEGTMRQAILQMKVQGEYQLAGQLADMLANLARSLLLGDRPIFVPVPRFGVRQQGDPRHFPQVACGTLSASCNGDSGMGLELQAISACVIGGASLAGGDGSIIGAVFGIALLAIITTSMILLNVSVYWQDLVSGMILLAAVSIDYFGHARAK